MEKELRKKREQDEERGSAAVKRGGYRRTNQVLFDTGKIRRTRYGLNVKTRH